MTVNLQPYKIVDGATDYPDKHDAMLDAVQNALNGGAQIVQVMGVLDKDLTTPPGSPADGAAYIVAATATGAWAGKEKHIAVWLDTASAWTFIAPAEGLLSFVSDEAKYYTYTSGSWVLGIAGIVGSVNNNALVYFNGSGELTSSSGLSFDGNNFGIGAIPTVTLDVNAAAARSQIKSTTGTNSAWTRWNNTGGNFYIGRDSSLGGDMAVGSSAYAGVISISTAHSLQFGTGNTIRETIDSSGNIGIAVAPSAWNSLYRALQISSGAYIAGRSDQKYAYFGSNYYVNSGGTPTYIGSGYASYYKQSDKTHQWGGAASGTAGGTVTFSVQWEIDSNNDFIPGTDNAYSIGNGSKRPDVIYAASGTINTSDAREKTPVRSLNENELAAARELAREPGVYQFLASVAEKGEDGARLHIGMTVQRAIEIMESHDLDPLRYGFICHDVWEAETKEVPAEDGEFSRPVTRQVVETVPVEYSEIEIIEGVPTRVKKSRFDQVPVVDQVGVVDEDGEPVMIEDKPAKFAVTNKEGEIVEPAQPATFKQLTAPVPRMETVEERYNIVTVREAGDRYSFRPDQLNSFMIAGLASLLE